MTTVLELLFPEGSKYITADTTRATSATRATSEDSCGLQKCDQSATACDLPADRDVSRTYSQADATPAGRINTDGSHESLESQAASTENTFLEPALPLTLEWLRGQGCAVDRLDLQFIERCLPSGTARRNATLRAYVRALNDAMDREPKPHRKDNRGRFTANTLLREGRL